MARSKGNELERLRGLLAEARENQRAAQGVIEGPRFSPRLQSVTADIEAYEENTRAREAAKVTVDACQEMERHLLREIGTLEAAQQNEETQKKRAAVETERARLKAAITQATDTLSRFRALAALASFERTKEVV